MYLSHIDHVYLLLLNDVRSTPFQLTETEISLTFYPHLAYGCLPLPNTDMQRRKSIGDETYRGSIA